MNNLVGVACARVHRAQRHKAVALAACFFFKLALSVFENGLALFELARGEFEGNFLIRIAELPYEKQVVVFVESGYAYSALVLYDLARSLVAVGELYLV